MKCLAQLIILVLTPVFAVSAAQEADDPSARGLASQQRRVAMYGFEEAGDFHTLLPAPFFRVLTRETGRPGLPHFGTVEVDNKIALEGAWSLRFDAGGASMMVALPPAELPIFPQSRYQVRAKVRTEGLANAGASIAVRLHDINGAEIPGTRRSCAPVQTHGGWTTLTIEPPTDVPSATDLVLELRVDQPSADDEGQGRGQAQQRKADISGSAWFDQIEVWQLPRIVFQATPRSGMTRLPDRPSLEATLRDLTTGAVQAVLRVRDMDGRIHQEQMLDLERGRSRLTMQLDDLPAGWYAGELEVIDENEVIARSVHGLVLLPDREPGRVGYGPPYFGVGFDSRQACDDQTDLSLLQMLRPDYAVLPLWEAGETGAFNAENTRQIDFVLDELHAARIEPVFELAAVPSDIQASQRLDAGQVMALLSSHEDAWGDSLKPWMAHYGDEVSRWRIRSEFGSEQLTAQSASLNQMAAFADEYVAAPVLEIRQPAGDMAEPSQLPEGVTASIVQIPSEIDPNQIASLMQGMGSSNVNVQLEPVSRMNTPRVQAEQTARRIVEAWAAGATHIELLAPWSVGESVENSSPGLESSGAAFRQLASFLSGRLPAVEVPLGRGVRAFLLGGRGEATVVAWAIANDTTVDFDLGADHFVIHDIFGGSQEVFADSAVHTLALSGAPVIIEGIDDATARFRASARMDPPTIDAAIGLHDMDLALSNPWDEAIDVRVKPIGPASFRFEPRSRVVTIQAGEEVIVPFSFAYPRMQIDGSVELRMLAEIQSAPSQDIELLLPTEIRSSSIALETEWKEVHDSNRRSGLIRVTIRAYNTGSTPLLLEAFTSAPGTRYAPMRKTMPEIPPGGSAGRTFDFPKGDELLAGHDLLVGVSAFEGDSRVVRRLSIPLELGSLVGVDPQGDE